MKENIKFSVIIPVYNAEKYIEKCIDSVLNQSYQNWELLAIDDGSKDSSYELLTKYANCDKRILVETKNNEGPGLTRNRGIRKSSGDYIVFLDSDDYIESNYFELLYKEIIKTNSDVLFINAIQEQPNGKILKFEKMSYFKKYDRDQLIGCQMTGYMPWGGWRKVASHALIKKNHLRYTDDIVGEEAIFSFELLRSAQKICFIENYLYHYINRPESQSKSEEGSWEITLKKMRKHLEDKNIKNKYVESLNAFAFTVLILWLVRNAKNWNSLQCEKKLREKIIIFEKEYGWNLNKQVLRPEVRVLYYIFKVKLLLPVIIIAKYLDR